MPPEFVPIALFFSIAAVAILRPLTTRIGKVIERSHAEKQAVPDPQVERLMQLMERLVDRMDRIEDRVDFTERILERQRVQAQLTTGGSRKEQSRSGSSSTRPGDDT